MQKGHVLVIQITLPSPYLACFLKRESEAMFRGACGLAWPQLFRSRAEDFEIDNGICQHHSQDAKLVSFDSLIVCQPRAFALVISMHLAVP